MFISKARGFLNQAGSMNFSPDLLEDRPMILILSRRSFFFMI